MTPGRRAWWGRLGGVDDVVVERVLRAVEQVPPGRVVSYGDVAALVGIGPRQVGSIMKAYGGNVTWWRVTDAVGQSAKPRDLAVDDIQVFGRLEKLLLRLNKVLVRQAHFEHRAGWRDRRCRRRRTDPAGATR